MPPKLCNERNKDSLSNHLSPYELLSWSYRIRPWGIEKLQFQSEKPSKQSMGRLNWAFWLRFPSYLISDCWSLRENSIPLMLMCLYFHLQQICSWETKHWWDFTIAVTSFCPLSWCCLLIYFSFSTLGVCCLFFYQHVLIR